MEHRRRLSGFTLIEILVVIAIIGIVLTIVGIRLGGDEDAAVENETQRLAAILRASREEAILTHRVLVFLPKAHAYSLEEYLGDGRTAPVPRDDLLRERTFGRGVKMVHFRAETGEADAHPRLWLLPTGDLAPFTAILARDQARWRITGDSAGVIQTRRLAPDESLDLVTTPAAPQ